MMEITTEIHFAQLLASNQQSVRDKALKKVGKWLATKSASIDAFTEDSMLKLWKGLYFYFWNCDKPLFQEEVADFISKFIHQFKNLEYSFMFIDTFFQTMSREWFSIDRYRLEKFMMFVRRFLHESFELLRREKWEIKWIKYFRIVMKKTVMNPLCVTCDLGLKTHVTDIYMEELAKVGSEELTPQLTQKFIVPYCNILIKCENLIFLNNVSKEIFLYLVNQDADEDEFHEFPVLKFDASSVQSLLMKFANKPDVTRKHLKNIYDIVKKFQDYKDGVSVSEKGYKDTSSGPKLRKRAIERAAISLLEEEAEFNEEKNKFKSSGKKIKVIDL